MEILDLNALRQMASGRWHLPEQTVCPDCGAPICAGIAALHRHCPAKEGTPITLFSRSRQRRKPRPRRAS